VYSFTMSGHSKWANIRVKKTAQDARRGKIFTRHARLIEITARSGGGDPDTNAALRVAIDNAKADSVPNANIERAVKKGSGETKGEAMAEVIYAATSAGGVAYLIECLTDNTNRTLANVKSIANKNGGRFAETGSVTWMFEQKGVVMASRPQPIGEEEQLLLIDAGAEDIELNGSAIIITTGRTALGKVRDLAKGQGYEVQTAGLKYIPKQTIKITDTEAARGIVHLIEALEEDDDIAEVHTNAEFADEVAASLE